MLLLTEGGVYRLNQELCTSVLEEGEERDGERGRQRKREEGGRERRGREGRRRGREEGRTCQNTGMYTVEYTTSYHHPNHTLTLIPSGVHYTNMLAMQFYIVV